MWQCLGVNFVCYIEVFSDKLCSDSACNALCEASQQLDKINIRDVPLLSASVTVVNTAHDLGVILDSQLSHDHCLLRQLRH